MTTHFTADQIAALGAPLDRAHVKTRRQAGRQVSYVEGWHAIAEANRIFGFDGWSSEIIELRLVREGERIADGGRALYTCTYIARCHVTVYAGDRVLIREGIGAGQGMDADPGQAHENACKAAETDARKRALMTFGNVFGLALYDRTQANVSDGADDQPSDAPPPSPAKASTPPPSPAARPAPRDAKVSALATADTARAAKSSRLRDDLLARLDRLHEYIRSPGQFDEFRTIYARQRSKVWMQIVDADRKAVTDAEIRVGKAREAAQAAQAAPPDGVYDPETGEVAP